MERASKNSFRRNPEITQAEDTGGTGVRLLPGEQEEKIAIMDATRKKLGERVNLQFPMKMI